MDSNLSPNLNSSSFVQVGVEFSSEVEVPPSSCTPFSSPEVFSSSFLSEGEELFMYQKRKKVLGDKLKIKFFIRLRDNSFGGEVFKCVLCREVFSKEFERLKVENEKSKDKRLRFKLDFFYKHLACFHRDELVKIGVDEIPQDRDCRNRLVKFFAEEGWRGDEKVIEELKKTREIKKPSLKRKRETSEGGRVEKVLVSCAPYPPSISLTSTTTPSTPSTSTTPSAFIAPDAAASSLSFGDDDSTLFSTCSSFSTTMVDFITSPPSSSLVSSSFSFASSSSSLSTTSQEVEEIESYSFSPCFDFEEAIRFLPYPSENAPSGSRKGGKKSLELSLQESYGVHYVPKALDFSSVLKIKKKLFKKYISQVFSFFSIF